MNKPLVIGVGNLYRNDDSIGLTAVREFRKQYPDQAEYILSDGDLAGIIDSWKNKDLVIMIDSVFTGKQPPGTIVELEISESILEKNEIIYSSHGIGILDALRLSKVLNTLPLRVIIIGVEGVSYEPGQKVNQAVLKILPKLLDLLKKKIHWSRS